MTVEICPQCYSELVAMDSVYWVCNTCGWNGEQPHSEYTVVNIPLDRIWSDDEFNCRGQIIPLDVVDLVKDIDKNGLQFPIAVQPRSDVGDFQGDCDFRIVAGHRRFKSYEILKRETIPAMVKPGLSEVKARLLNLGENLKREALNILQESKAIVRLRDLGLNRRQVGEELGKSTSWVQVRFNLLDLPEEIQEEAAAGILNQKQIKELFSLSGKTEQYEAVKKIKNARMRGEKGVSVSKPPSEDPFKKRRQPKNVVQEMIEHIGSRVGFGLPTRCLAWANGEINSAELFFDISNYADSQGIPYTVPLAGFEEKVDVV